MFQEPFKILDGATANGIGTPIQVVDFRHLVFALDTTGTTTGTVKFQGSIQRDKPDFSAAQSPTNQWDYVKVTDLEDGAGIAGDTGIQLSGADDNRMVELDVNALMWACAIISGYSQGTIHVLGLPRNDAK